MQSLTTISRPYAKAILELAAKEHAYAQWSDELHFLALVAQDPQANKLLHNLALPAAKKAEFICALAPLSNQAQNLVKLLAYEDRLLVLPALYALYETLRKEAEHQVDLQLTVARATPAAAIKDLTSHIAGEVSVVESVNEKLLGGAVARIGDRVIDGSMQGKLQALREFMVSS